MVGEGGRVGGEAYECALTASRSRGLDWLMMKPIRRPLAPKSGEVVVVSFIRC